MCAEVSEQRRGQFCPTNTIVSTAVRIQYISAITSLCAMRIGEMYFAHRDDQIHRSRSISLQNDSQVLIATQIATL